MISMLIQQEEMTILNIIAPNTGASKYIMQVLTELQGEMDSSTIIVGNLNILRSAMDRLSSQLNNN
jgi:glyceraldehyde-3-phosphate dehydrogenase/erythrose-4-phosphate dehydrogenase